MTNTTPEETAVDDRFEEPEIKDIEGINTFRWSAQIFRESAATKQFPELETVAKAIVQAITDSPHRFNLCFNGDHLDVWWVDNEPTDEEIKAVKAVWHAAGGKSMDINTPSITY